MKNFSLYGLPEKVSYCKSCVISNQRPFSTIEFENSDWKNKKYIKKINFKDNRSFMFETFMINFQIKKENFLSVKNNLNTSKLFNLLNNSKLIN